LQAEARLGLLYFFTGVGGGSEAMPMVPSKGLF
jgi:hypothetical protein